MGSKSVIKDDYNSIIIDPILEEKVRKSNYILLHFIIIKDNF